jgi:DMSO reductase anchor subunit
MKIKMEIVAAAIFAILGVISFLLNFGAHRILGIVFFIIAAVIAVYYYIKQKK